MRYNIAGGALIKKSNKYLLVKLKTGQQKGLWSIPGGCAEDGETFAEAAIRETKEETGLEVSLGDVINIIQENFGHFCITVVFKAEIKGGELKIQNDEIKEVKWFSYEEIQKIEKDKISSVAYIPINNYDKNRKYTYTIDSYTV